MITNSYAFALNDNIDISQSSSKNNINGIFINDNYTLLSLATNEGYRIYSLISLSELGLSCESDGSMKMIGPLKIAIPLHQSEIIMLVGKNNFSSIRDNQIVLWNDDKKTQMSMITFKTNEIIISAKISKEGIFAAFSSYIKILSLQTMETIATIKDVVYSNDHYYNNINLSINEKCSFISIIDICSNNRSNIKLNIFKYDQSLGKINGRYETTIPTPFRSIYKLAIDKKGNLICAVSNSNNRIHMYSTYTKKIITCFDIDNEIMQIINISIGKKGKFISVFYANHILEIYQVKEGKEVKCKCFTSLDEKKSLIKEILKDNNSCFARYKFNYQYIDEIVSSKIGKGEMMNNYIIYFTKISEINLVDSHGIFQKIKFNSQKKDTIWCYREITFLGK